MSNEKFLEAQEQNNSHEKIKKELINGKKQTHCMWYTFPQIHGLGSSEIAQYYSIKNLDEAREYLRHPILKQRLIELCRILLFNDETAEEIFGYPDDLKLRSSMTLFSHVSDEPVFKEVLKHFFDEPCGATLGKILEHESNF